MTTLFDPGPPVTAPLPYGWRRSVDGTVYQPGSGHIGAYIAHGGRKAWVDAPMAPIIVELWRAGIDTVSCCQDHDGLAGVVFSGARYAEAFLDLLADDDVLGGRIRDRRRWRYETWPYPYADADVIHVVLNVEVAFPLDDVPEIVRCLQER